MRQISLKFLLFSRLYSFCYAKFIITQYLQFLNKCILPLFDLFLFWKTFRICFFLLCNQVIYASAWDIEYVSIYRFPNHDAAYAIVSFKSHRNAALARRKLRPERLFKCNEVHVEWARVDWNPTNVVSRKL